MLQHVQGIISRLSQARMDTGNKSVHQVKQHKKAGALASADVLPNIRREPMQSTQSQLFHLTVWQYY